MRTMDRDFAGATMTLLESLKDAGYDVETPVTGSVIVDGVEIDRVTWDKLCTSWDGTDEGLEVIEGAIEDIEPLPIAYDVTGDGSAAKLVCADCGGPDSGEPVHRGERWGLTDARSTRCIRCGRDLSESLNLVHP